MHSFIPASDTWGIWTVLLGAAAAGLWAERTALGGRLSGAVVTILIAFGLSNLGIIPARAPAYDSVWTYLVPLAIPLLLLHGDLRRILRESGPVLTAFLVGAVGTVAGVLVAYAVVPLGPQAEKLAGIFAATYTGGSMNYMGTADAVGLRSGDLLTAGVAADNLMMTVYFLVLFALPSLPALERSYRRPQGSYWAWVAEGAKAAQPESRPTLEPGRIAAALTASAAICTAGFGVEEVIGWDGSGILVLTGLSVGLATSCPQWLGQLEGSERLGTFFMQVFFAVIGASAHIGTVLTVGPVLFVFAGLILAVHLGILLTAGKALGLSLPELCVASNANMGGPTTAAAMATAKHWEALIIPAILVGTLGYAGGTFLGTAITAWLH
ncbi:MAG TPA: DUF819 family protein [Gammaproteobacteria bacterium]|nr:DUF819 family protein [Gammaproteobacteria bacterium]